jgi:hypothetical protein
MSKLRNQYVAVVLGVAALAAAGCGSSSSSKSKTPTSPAASTPVTPSTTGTTATPLTASSPITDPRYRAALIKGIALAAKGRISPSDQARLADCAIKKYQAEGVMTVGEANGKKSQARTFGAQCAAELHITLR